MPFDILSFLAGVAAGAITGALAGVLHSLENTAGLHEKLRHITMEVERLRKAIAPDSDAISKGGEFAEIDRLQRELDEIQAEIRRMYKKSRS